jgi:RNA polymerase sigma-70 factor (ECF subfamily)
MADPLRPDLIELDEVRVTNLGQYEVVASAFDTYHAELYGFLRRSTRDERASEDLLQETFLRLTKEVDAGRTPEHLRAWLYRVATNLTVSRGRRASTAVAWLNTHGRQASMVRVESPESDVLEREGRAALEAALAALPTDARTAMLLSAEGFNGDEIAVAIGRTNAATRTLLTRARVRVRLALEGTGGAG